MRLVVTIVVSLATSTLALAIVNRVGPLRKIAYPAAYFPQAQA